ncbi:RNA polymerase sigma factor [Paenibacillus thermotolerans]|uniref:RNA polymerase sigma factor n=1 Tax=Paenibacillus thermotolerans TaxID=3027807 RepID=UPI002368A506|nr:MULTISPECIES: RNA polymerase sigma factor [unclassified Paenibacillus]
MLFFGAKEKERGVSEGDAFERALAPLQDALAGYCRSVAGNRWDADDLLQETITKAYVRYVHTGRADFKKAYLYRIASNAWIDKLRREREHPYSLDGAELSGLGLTESPIEAAVDARWAVETIISGLPAKQRTVLLLAEAFQLTLAEIAALTGTTEGAVKSLLRRSRDRLDRLRKAGEPGLRAGGAAGREAGAAADEAADGALVEAYLRALQSGSVSGIVALGGAVTAAADGPSAQAEGARKLLARSDAAASRRAGLGFAEDGDGSCTFALHVSAGGRSCIRVITARAGDAIAV